MDLAPVKSQRIAGFAYWNSFRQVNNGPHWPIIKQIFQLFNMLETYPARIPLNTGYALPDFKP